MLAKVIIALATTAIVGTLSVGTDAWRATLVVAEKLTTAKA